MNVENPGKKKRKQAHRTVAAISTVEYSVSMNSYYQFFSQPNWPPLSVIHATLIISHFSHSATGGPSTYTTWTTTLQVSNCLAPLFFILYWRRRPTHFPFLLLQTSPSNCNAGLSSTPAAGKRAAPFAHKPLPPYHFHLLAAPGANRAPLIPTNGPQTVGEETVSKLS